MPWVRWGDTSANHPIVLSVLEHEECDDRLVNEVHGFVSRCAAQSGAHKTDYVVSRGTAVLMAGHSRADKLLEIAVWAGYMTHVRVGDRDAYKLVDTDSEFLHLRLKEEVEFEQQRRKDNSNPALTVPVRLRDGDACRWCGHVVDWGSRKAGRSGTYDHLIPGTAATVETYVVCCRSCNSSRKDGTRPRSAEQLLGEPNPPYFSDHTLDWLEENDWRKKNRIAMPSRPRKTVKPGDLAPGITPAATVTAPTPAGVSRPDIQSGSGSTPEDTATAARPAPAPRTGNQSANATSQSRSEHHSENAPPPDPPSPPAPTPLPPEIRGLSADSAEREGTESVWTGRAGSGRVGSGLVGDPSPPTAQRDVPADPDPPEKPVRSRRRRRGRSRTKTVNPSALSGDTHV
ncbi:hypothetical protein CH267_00885 [Rhodococcus sp. 06-621-2]|nr:hypothetical protein CH267_00885 [Rhodococcus sp. 06-621-2]